MIPVGTNLDVADNSGARSIRCIRILGHSRIRYARIGDIIVVAVKDAIPEGMVKKGEVAKETALFFSPDPDDLLPRLTR